MRWSCTGLIIWWKAILRTAVIVFYTKYLPLFRLAFVFETALCVWIVLQYAILNQFMRTRCKRKRCCLPITFDNFHSIQFWAVLPPNSLINSKYKWINNFRFGCAASMCEHECRVRSPSPTTSTTTHVPHWSSVLSLCNSKRKQTQFAARAFQFSKVPFAVSISVGCEATHVMLLMPHND